MLIDVVHIVLLDNASAHKTLLSKRALERKFQPLFQPAHSCRFNNIEFVWGLAKMAVRKKLLQKTSDLTKAQFDKLVLESCEEVARKHWKKITTANHKYLAKMLSS